MLALVIGLSNVPLGCGPCTLVRTMDIVIDGGGSRPLPCDLSYLGVQF